MRTAPRTTLALALTGAGALALTACGADKTRRNDERPPAAILLSAAVTPTRVSISPRRTGAGPVTVIVANLTGSAQQVTFQSDDLAGAGKPGIKQQTGQIDPRHTATLSAQLQPGRYEISVPGDQVEPATIIVGRERRSSQNDLSLP